MAVANDGVGAQRRLAGELERGLYDSFDGFRSEAQLIDAGVELGPEASDLLAQVALQAVECPR